MIFADIVTPCRSLRDMSPNQGSDRGFVAWDSNGEYSVHWSGGIVQCVRVTTSGTVTVGPGLDWVGALSGAERDQGPYGSVFNDPDRWTTHPPAELDAPTGKLRWILALTNRSADPDAFRVGKGRTTGLMTIEVDKTSLQVRLIDTSEVGADFVENDGGGWVDLVAFDPVGGQATVIQTVVSFG